MKRLFASLLYRLRHRAAVRRYRQCSARTTQLFADYAAIGADLRAALAAENKAEKHMEQFITTSK